MIITFIFWDHHISLVPQLLFCSRFHREWVLKSSFWHSAPEIHHLNFHSHPNLSYLLKKYGFYVSHNHLRDFFCSSKSLALKMPQKPSLFIMLSNVRKNMISFHWKQNIVCLQPKHNSLLEYVLTISIVLLSASMFIISKDQNFLSIFSRPSSLLLSVTCWNSAAIRLTVVSLGTFTIIWQEKTFKFLLSSCLLR